MELSAAEQLAEMVNALGVEAGVAPIQAVSRYRRRLPVRKARCDSDGMRVVLGDGNARLVPWDAIHAGSLALCREPSASLGAPVHGGPFRGLPATLTATLGLAWTPTAWSWAQQALRSREEVLRGEHRIEAQETYILDLFLSATPVALRIDARRFHYGYLGERMHERCELNFQALLADIADHARRATFAPAVRRMLEGDLLLDAVATDLGTITLFNRWFLLAVAAFPPGGKGAPKT